MINIVHYPLVLQRCKRNISVNISIFGNGNIMSDNFFYFWFICRFDIPDDREKYFDHATRSRIVNFILRRKSFSKAKEKAYSFGRSIKADRNSKFWPEINCGHITRNTVTVLYRFTTDFFFLCIISTFSTVMN